MGKRGVGKGGGEMGGKGVCEESHASLDTLEY